MPSARRRARTSAFDRRVVSIPVGGNRPYDEREWVDSLVLLRHGDIEIECELGGRRRFGPGSVMWLVGLAVRTIHNAGDVEVVLVAVSRRRPTGLDRR